MGSDFIRDRSFYKSVLSIMLPAALQQAINMGVNLMDTMMLGSFGKVQLSASSLANQYYSLYLFFCLGIIGGCSVLAAQYWGAGDKEHVHEIFNLGIRLAAAIAIVFSVLTYLFPEQIMRIYSPDPVIIQQGARYLRVTAFIFLIHGTSFVTCQLMRTVGQARLGLIVSCISFGVNLFANYVFIFGKFGAPRLEIAGAAVGTLISRVVECIVTFSFVFHFDKALCLRPTHLLKAPSGDCFRRYLHVGVPVFVSDLLLSLGSQVISVVLGHMGDMAVAANSICQVVDRLCTVIIYGIGNAAAVIVGNTIGSGDKPLALRQGKTLYTLSILFGAAASVLIYFIGPYSIHLYNLDAETIRVTNAMMHGYAIIVFFQSTQMVLTKGVLRGGGDTHFLMLWDTLFLWLVSIPLGAVGGLILHWPAWTVMLCLRADFMLKTVLCTFRLRGGKWIHDVRKKQI